MHAVLTEGSTEDISIVIIFNWKDQDHFNDKKEYRDTCQK